MSADDDPRPSSARSGGANLRREARVAARVKVSVVRGRQTATLETSNVSFKGLFLRMDEPPPVRSLMRLRVALPVREIEAHAMAVHVTATSHSDQTSHAAGVGVQFWGLAGPNRVAWDDFVRELIQTRRAAARSSSEKGDGPTTLASSGVHMAASGSMPSSDRAIATK
jgi:hypothetical protein